MKIKNAAKMALIVGALSASAAHADTILGVYLGGHVWNVEPEGTFKDNGTALTDTNFAFNEETRGSFYIALEHPVPFVPNLKVRHNDMGSSGTATGSFTFGNQEFTGDATTDADLTNTDFLLYYEVLDNGLVSFDFGVNVKYIDGTFDVVGTDIAGAALNANESFSGPVPMGYVAAKAGLPLSGLSVFGDISILSVGDHSLTDFQVGLGYEFIDSLAVDVTAQVGYRQFQLELEDLEDIDSDLDYSGIFAGLEVHF